MISSPAGPGLGLRLEDADLDAQLADDLAKEVMADYLIGEPWMS